MQNFVEIKKLIDDCNLDGIRQALVKKPQLANEAISYDENNNGKAHPLHRICDGVFSKRYSDSDAVEMAKIFLDFGASVDGYQLVEKQDSPLIAAASLHADLTALLYLDNGANIYHGGTHGGTALHWAAWCGRDALVKELIQRGAAINRRCVDFKSTPLFWAIHGWKSCGSSNTEQYAKCVQMLVQAGADLSLPNAEGVTVFDLLATEDAEMKKSLSIVP